MKVHLEEGRVIMGGKDEVNGYDVFENETVSAPEPEPEEDSSDDD